MLPTGRLNRPIEPAVHILRRATLNVVATVSMSPGKCVDRLLFSFFLTEEIQGLKMGAVGAVIGKSSLLRSSFFRIPFLLSFSFTEDPDTCLPQKKRNLPSGKPPRHHSLPGTATAP